MNWELRYKNFFVADIKKLDKPIQIRITKALGTKLIKNPLVFSKPLLENLSGIRQYREGDYRIFFVIEEQSLLFLGVLHRSIAHKVIEKRMKRL